MDQKEIDRIIDNDREWRRVTLESLREIRDTLKCQNGRLRKVEIAVALIIGSGVVGKLTGVL